MIEIGQILNDTYRIDSEIGHGGGGLIFKAYHIRMRKYVAVKLIRDRVKSMVDVRAEVDILKDLKHPYLPIVMDYIDDGEGNIYTVMEYIDGENFSQILSDGTGITEKRVVQYMIELCDAVMYLHSQTPVIIHSDIKPANIMRTKKGHICLIDFNISTIGNTSENGMAVSYGGSHGFAAPEQFKKIISTPEKIEDFHEQTRFIDADETELYKSEADASPKAYVDVRTDVYGLGATMYYMLTRRVPTGGKVSVKGKGVSKELLRIIEKATDPNPSKRYTDADTMKADLEKCAPYAKDVLPNFVTVEDNIKLIPIIAGASLAAAIILVIVLLNRNDSSEIESTEQTSTSVTTTSAETSALEETPTESARIQAETSDVVNKATSAYTSSESKNNEQEETIQSSESTSQTVRSETAIQTSLQETSVQTTTPTTTTAVTTVPVTTVPETTVQTTVTTVPTTRTTAETTVTTKKTTKKAETTSEVTTVTTKKQKAETFKTTTTSSSRISGSNTASSDSGKSGSGKIIKGNGTVQTETAAPVTQTDAPASDTGSPSSDENVGYIEGTEGPSSGNDISSADTGGSTGESGEQSGDTGGSSSEGGAPSIETGGQPDEGGAPSDDTGGSSSEGGAPTGGMGSSSGEGGAPSGDMGGSFV